jgi:LytR cell envelope-related transcriptional attenuator
MRRRSGSDGERGLALPSWAIGVSVGVVVVAMLAFVVTGSPDRGDEAAADPVTSTDPSGQPSEPTGDPSADPSAEPSDRSKPSQAATKRPRPDRDQTAQRRDSYVEIYNNSAVPGLANQTAAELQDAGWKVVGADNWYGDIPESTVYYPSRLRDVAKLLAADLGIKRLHTAVAPMRFDRLTVILTGPL